MLIKMIMNKLYLECNMRRSVLLTVIVFYISLLHMNTAYSNYTKALKAFEEKDWVKCIKICKDIPKDEDRCDNLLGLIYLNGYGKEKDYGKAFFYFSKAVEKGNAIAYKNLSWMYSKGLGVKKNLDEASRLLDLSEKKQVVLKKEVSESPLNNNLNEENKNIAIFRNFFSEYQKFQILLKFYDINENYLNFDIVLINNKIKLLEDNINLEYEEKIKLKNKIIDEQKIVLKLFSLSLKSGSVTLEDEIKKIYSKLYKFSF